MQQVAFVSPLHRVAPRTAHASPVAPICVRRRAAAAAAARGGGMVWRMQYNAVTPGVPIVAGAIALATPFFVAAVLFGERIVRQRNCTACDGSGLVPNRAGLLKRCTK